MLISNLLSWIADYFKKNEVVDIIPYEKYIEKSFKEYPFVQTNSFKDDQVVQTNSFKDK